MAVRPPGGGFAFPPAPPPPQPVWAPPYAMSLMPGAIISGSLGGFNTLTVKNTALDGLAVLGSSDGGIGVEGITWAITDTHYGVYGLSYSPQGYGGYFENRPWGGQGGGGGGGYGKTDLGTGVSGLRGGG